MILTEHSEVFSSPLFRHCLVHVPVVPPNATQTFSPQSKNARYSSGINSEIAWSFDQTLFSVSRYRLVHVPGVSDLVLLLRSVDSIQLLLHIRQLRV